MQMDRSFGKIDVSNEVIAAIAGGAAANCYGLVGLTSRKRMKDGFSELLGKDHLSRGVVVSNNDGNVEVDLHVIVRYGVQISEVAYNAQMEVKRALKEMIGLDVSGVNVFARGVRASEPRSGRNG